MKKIFLLLTFCLLWLGLKAQTTTYINDAFNINAGTPVVWHGDVIFGPNAVVYIEDGAIAYFYGKNMTVNPAAQFIALPGSGQIGTGNIVFRENNPLYPGYPLQQTLNGGYGTSGANPTFINIEVDNANGLSLSGNVRVANQVKFTKGHIYLNDFNLVLAEQGLFAGADVSKHVVSNGLGLISKEALASGANFYFPLSIAGTDYTPVIVTNQEAARNINVQVKDYASSIANETSFPNKGMDRTWQISSNVAGKANISLQHNSANNPNGLGTNQSLFNNSLSYVSQQLSAGIWSQNCVGVDGGTPTSINLGNFVLPATADETSYFTKTTVTCVDLEVIKTVNSVVPKVGNVVTFTVEALNNGVIDATSVIVNDLLPSGYTYVSSTVTTGTYDPATGIWTIGALANAATAKLTVSARINVSGDYKNIASISGGEQDSDLINNTDEVVLTPDALQANLAIDKTVDNASPVKGNNVVFTIDVQNNGPDNATDVIVNDLLPSGYTYVSHVASVGTYSSSTGIWSIGTLNNTQTAKLTITATVNASGTYNNTANVVATESDPVMGNNSSTVVVNPDAPLVNLSIVKTAPATLGVAIGDEFDYSIEVKNMGTQLATGIVAIDDLPTYLSFVSATTGYGTVTNSGKKVTWNIGNLSVGATITLTLRVKAELPGFSSNTATVTSTQPDSDMSNNTSTAIKEILDLTFPNVITPNGDGKNDTFKILGLAAYSQSNMFIYNRWNSEVWRSTGRSYENDWNGDQLGEGTYFYVIKLKDRNGLDVVFKGWVMLLRD
jgi:gliding motility-associated-like protein/uncharacterized repeat protein (TIGR01451 family)